MAKKLIKTLNGKNLYAKCAETDENGVRIADRKVKSVSVSGNMMTVESTDGVLEVPIVPGSDPADVNKVLTVNSSGAPVWAPAQGGGGGGVQEQADWAETDNTRASFIRNKPDLGIYATSAAVNSALAGKQDTIGDLNAIREGARSGATAVQPGSLASVATSGSYGDLNGKPDLSVYATVDAMNTALGSKQDTISDLSTIRDGAREGSTAVQPGDLAAVATSGDYGDLDGKPDLSVYVTVDAMTAALGSKQDTISDLSAIRDGASAGASAVQPGSLARVATTGNYGDLNGKPDLTVYATVNAMNTALESKQDSISDIETIRSGASAGASAVQPATLESAINAVRQVPSTDSAETNDVLTVNSSGVPVWARAQGGGGGGTQEQANWAETDNSKPSFIMNKPSLSTVATSGSYNDLTDKPSIPTAQVNADWDSDTGVSQILNKPANLVQDASYVHTDNNFTAALKGKLDGIETGAQVNVQADWDESDSGSPSYIANKPTIPAAQVNADWNSSSGVSQILNKPTNLVQDANYTHTDNNFTAALKDKLDGIETGAQVNVQADWNESDSSDPSYIANKPTIPTVNVNDVTVNGSSVVSNGTAAVVIPEQVQADWNESDSSDPSFIANKPEIPEAQVNADWTASSGVAEILHKPSLATVATSGDYGDLLNKPEIPAAQVNSDWNASSGVAQILNKPSIPADTGDLTNNAGFITEDDIPVTDVQVGGTSVVNNGVAEIPAQVNADWNSSSGVSQILNKPDNLVQDASYVHTDNNFTTSLKNKLDGIATGAEVNVQADWNQNDSNSDDFIKNKPTIPAAQVNSDWDASSGVAQILHKPDLSVYATTSAMNTALSTKQDTIDDLSDIRSGAGAGATAVQPGDLAEVATTGSYNNLTDKPTIPENVSDLNNDEGFITLSEVPAQAQADWNESDDSAPSYIANKPTIPAAQVNSDWNSSSGVSQILNKPSLATVAASGDYGDLLNKPEIPAAQVNSDWNASSGVAQILNKPSIPADTGDLTNGAGFITSADIPVVDVQVGSTSVVNNQGVAEIPAQVSADWNSSSGVSQILNKPANLVQDANYVHTDNNFTTSLKDKLDGIATGAEVNVQADWNETSSSADSFIKNKPSIPTKTSDLQNDSGFLTTQAQANWNESDSSAPSYIANKPTIPAAQVNADWTASSGVAEILHKPNLATVATTGSYEDLNNKPTIPAAQVNSDWNASTGVAQILNKPSIPADTGDLTNGAGFITSADIPVTDVQIGSTSVVNNQGIAEIPAQVNADWGETDNSDPSYIANKPNLATVATTGDYDDLVNKPSIPAAQVNADWNASSGVAQILNKPSLATVATSGDYDDLTNKPTIPTVNVNDVTVNGSSVVSNGTAAVVIPAQVQADWNESDDSDPSYIANKPTIPAAQVNADWTASSGVAEILHKPSLATVATSGDYDDLVNKPTIPAAQVNADWTASSGVAQILHKPSLAAVATSGDYDDLTNKPTIPTVNVNDVTVNGSSVVSNGTAAVVIPAQVQADWNESDNSDPSYIANKPTIPAAQVNADWTASSGVAEILHKPSLAAVATSGDYDDLTNKPTIPAAQVNSDWNASSGVAQILNKPSLAAVATSGDYDDLTNKPTIPTVNVDDVTVNGSSVVSNGTAAIVIPAQVQADWTEADNSDPSYIANKPTLSTVATTGSYSDLSNTPDLTLKADKVSSATSGDFAALDSNGNLTDSGVSAGSFKTVQTAVTDPSADGTAISFIDSITQNANGVIAPTKKTIPADLVSRTVYVGQDCVYNDKEFWGNASTVADVISDYANQTVTDYRGNSVSLVRFQAEYDSNRFRIAAIDETPGTVEYNRKIGGQIVDLIRTDYWMSSLSGYDILKFDNDMSGLFDLLMSGSPMHAYLSLYEMRATTFLTASRREMYMDMIKAYDAWPYADKDTAYSDFMNAHSLDRFVQVATSWPINDWTSYRYVMAGTKTATDKMIFVIRHAERGDDTSVNGDINSTGVTTCTTMGQQVRDGESWTSGSGSYQIDNFPANDATYYSTEYLRCKHSAQAFASARYDTDFAASDYSGVTVEADMLNQYRFFYQPASSGNSTLIRKYSVNPSQLTSTELQTNFGVSTASEAETKLANDYVQVCKEILNKSTARLNMFYTHDFFTLPLAVMASNKAITFSSSGSNWINYCAGIGMILHPDNTYEVMPVRGKSSGTMSI